jgi:hypothetical protein
MMEGNEIDACAFCGDPLDCDGACEHDRVRQEQASDEVVRLAEARVRRSTLWVDFDANALFQAYVNNQTKAYKEVLDA